MFEIKDKFYLNGNPFQIVSGAVHYFRVAPEYWRDRLEKLKNMGCNTVETYIPWNFHEPKKGEFLWDGMRDICRLKMNTAINEKSIFSGIRGHEKYKSEFIILGGFYGGSCICGN